MNDGIGGGARYDEMRLNKAVQCLQLLTKGNSIRATTRISGVAKDTVIGLLVCVGEKCEAFLREQLQSVPATDVQADEIWGFVGMKEKTRVRKKICTSHVERHNLSMRMQNRRLTRLTNAFSKKWANHDATLGLYFAVYNFVRPHGTLTKNADGRKTTPAMASGLADHPWTLLELLEAIA